MSDFFVTDAPESKLLGFLKTGLHEESVRKGLPDDPFLPLGIFKFVGSDLIGGLSGQSHWGQLLIQQIFVDPAFRKQGLGSALLREAEEEACRRHCTGVRVKTNSLEAPDFYENRGYRLADEIPGFPNQSSMRWYIKPMPCQNS